MSLLKFCGRLGSITHNMRVKQNKNVPQRDTIGTANLWDCNLKEKPKMTDAIVYGCLRSVERKLEKKKSPIFFDIGL
jgi:hypothetical protein